MPIRDPSLYPKNWKAIRNEIMERAEKVGQGFLPLGRKSTRRKREAKHGA